MRAVSCEGGELSLVDLPAPEPGPGQLVLRVRRTGICGSDLHARRHADDLAAVMDELDYAHSIRSTEPTVLGHELCGEVVAQGRGTARSFPVGSRVVAFPLVRGTEGVHPIGLSPLAPGGYAEQVLVEASMAHVVPDKLDDDLAALTEPMAVALHAVRRGEVGKRDTAIVLGCGPVGLAVILLLKARGVRAHVDDSDDRMPKKIRTHTKAKVPYLLIAGEDDRAQGAVSFRFRDGTQLNGVPVADAIQRITGAIERRSQEL